MFRPTTASVADAVDFSGPERFVSKLFKSLLRIYRWLISYRGGSPSHVENIPVLVKIVFGQIFPHAYLMLSWTTVSLWRLSKTGVSACADTHRVFQRELWFLLVPVCRHAFLFAEHNSQHVCCGGSVWLAFGWNWPWYVLCLKLTLISFRFYASVSLS